jgi:DNA polymerase II
MKGFVVYPTYKIIDSKAYVHLYGRLENGESFLTINEFKPYFYIRQKDENKLKNIDSEINYEIEESKMKNFFDEPTLKIILTIPNDIPVLRDLFHKEDIPTYEADIKFVYRYLMDKQITGSLHISGRFEKGDKVDRVYHDPQLKSIEYFPKLKTMAIDIETSMNMQKLFSISIGIDDYTKVLIVSKKKLKNAEIFDNEKDMLIEFKNIIIKQDPDIITGWNVIDFDFKILKQKFDEHGISFVLGRNDQPSRVMVFDSFLKDSKAYVQGRMILDGIHLLKTSFITLTDYKLDTAATEILGKKKLDVFDNDNKGEEIERLFRDEPQKLVDYNLVDSTLVLDILNEKKLIELTIQRSLLTGMALDRVRASIASLDNLYIRHANQLGYVCNSLRFNQRGERITGGYVRDSIPGIYDHIDVLDFKSLYPSIMRTFNIDPLSYIPKELHDKYKKKDYIESPNGAKFKRDYGILPQILEKLWIQRDDAKKRRNNEESFAVKITMNSFFGVLANPNCRFYSLDMANAITHWARFVIKTTADIATKKGYRVIYGDTDSIFIETKANDENESIKIGEATAQYVNEYWNKFTKKLNVKNYMELQFEKNYLRFLMPMGRNTTEGAKKRYAGLKIQEGKEKVDFTGLEFVRRDWTDLSKEFQLELIDRIFHNREVVDYVKEFVKDVKDGKKDELLVYRKSLRKKLDQYTKTTPPHVKAARKLDHVTSSIIAYVMTIDGPEPLQKLKSKIDYDHYIEKQIKPIADSVLVFFDTKFDELLMDTKQTSLFGFG